MEPKRATHLNDDSNDANFLINGRKFFLKHFMYFLDSLSVAQPILVRQPHTAHINNAANVIYNMSAPSQTQKAIAF